MKVGIYNPEHFKDAKEADEYKAIYPVTTLDDLKYSDVALIGDVIKACGGCVGTNLAICTMNSTNEWVG